MKVFSPPTLPGFDFLALLWHLLGGSGVVGLSSIIIRLNCLGMFDLHLESLLFDLHHLSIFWFLGNRCAHLRGGCLLGDCLFGTRHLFGSVPLQNSILDFQEERRSRCVMSTSSFVLFEIIVRGAGGGTLQSSRLSTGCIAAYEGARRTDRFPESVFGRCPLLDVVIGGATKLNKRRSAS